MQEALKSLEEKILDIWNECSVFDIDELTVDDNFFDIGGNSIYAIKVIVRIKEEFEVDISTKTFFNNATIKDLSKVIYNLINITKDVSDEDKGERDTFEL